jgi:hypothetical protein
MDNQRSSPASRLSLAALIAVAALSTKAHADNRELSGVGPFLRSGNPHDRVVAERVAGFREEFPVASLGFNEDGTQVATNGDFAAQEVHIRYGARSATKRSRDTERFGPHVHRYRLTGKGTGHWDFYGGVSARNARE